ncbi:uncharacterized protein B0T15DRAFT_524618 [Chaetomium strumarium]|uniref:Uncharacterized protein n=1 Tax=Chaetomium strumarium TaxID=1170767 RepID=A0AAJ0GYI8_9PEZI|nr:hypothetical protein B0T15DRAFT_524618 [Chaetomium strumarium]
MMYSRGLSVVFAALPAFAAVNAALPDNGLDFHIALMSRQAPGTPAYDCHFNCGSTISGGRVENHCDNSTWVELYEACLDCALDFDIWQYYSNGVTSAARACGLSPTPSPSGDSGSSSSATGAASTSASISAGVSSAGTTAAPGSSSTTAALNTTFSLPTTAPPSDTAATESTASPTSSVSTAGAPGRQMHAAGYMRGISTLAGAMFLGLIGQW